MICTTYIVICTYHEFVFFVLLFNPEFVICVIEIHDMYISVFNFMIPWIQLQISRIQLMTRDMYISEISFHDINNLIRDIINSIRDIRNWIYDIMKLNIYMYISWIPITHITNSGLNSKTAFQMGTTSWTRASLTMQLTGDVSVFERVCGQNADISINCCKLDNSSVCRTVWWDMFRFIKHDVVIRPPDIVCRRTYVLPGILSFFLSFFFFIFSSATRGARWTELNHIRSHGWK